MPERELKNEISILSTDQAVDFVKRGLRKLDELSGVMPRPIVQDKAKMPLSKAVFINPKTEQRSSFTELDENRMGIETLLSQGYVLAESEGRLPPWLFSR